MNAALLSSTDMTWQTPPEFLDLVRAVGDIAFDPATTPDNPVGARYFCDNGEHGCGLAADWGRTLSCLSPARGLAYVNPPYGRELPKWIAKMALEGGAGAEIIALIPARPDTRAWQRDIRGTADRVCFLAGRIRFVGAPAAAPFPSAVIYWGERGDEFHRVFSPRGWVVSL